MSLIVEDGSGAADSNAYVSLSDCAEYCAARGLTFPTSPSSEGEQAIIRATAAIDAKYRSRFPGTKVNGRSQALQWPRTGAEDADGEEIADDEIPQEIINATCEAAARELAEAGSMLPDLERGGQIKSLKAGSVAIEYGGAAPATTTFQVIDGILSGLLGAQTAGFIATSVRG